MYDALRYALTELDKEGKQRRKAIVVLTDGLDTQLRNSDRPLLAKAQNDQDAIAAIDPKASNALNAVLPLLTGKASQSFRWHCRQAIRNDCLYLIL